MSMNSTIVDRLSHQQQEGTGNGLNHGLIGVDGGAKSLMSNENSKNNANLRATESRNLAKNQQPYPVETASSISASYSIPNEDHKTTDLMDHLFQKQKGHASSLTSASISTGLSRPRVSQQRVHNATKQQDPRSPLVTLIPTSANPTEILAQRFAAWRSIIRSILIYLTETVSIQDEIVRQQLRLSHAVNFPFFATENQLQPSTPEEKAIQRFFLPFGTGSVQDLPNILSQFHSQMANNALKASKDLANEVVPRLEDLRGDLLIKIKEIKGLASDFKNACVKEVHQTKTEMKQFQDAVELARYSSPKQDPHLLKMSLERQIRKQLSEENLLHEAFDNLQGSGRELEKVVVMEIQNALTIYARLMGQNAQAVFDILISKLDEGFFNKEPVFEWDNFVAKDSNFIEPNLPVRSMRDIVYKYQDDPLTYEIKSGYLERRSKFLKSYSKGFYLLTPSYLHEFKTPDRKRDPVPVMSLSLTDCTVAEHSKKGSSEYKFILHAKQNGIIHRGHNWVFRVESYDSMLMWFEDLKKLTLTSNPTEKAKFVTSKLMLNTEKSVSRKVSSKTNGRETVHPNSHSAQQYRNSSLAAPNLDNQTNTNTSISIPETEYSTHRVNLDQPRISRGSGEHSYVENLYIDDAKDQRHSRESKPKDMRHY
ncbi:LADA_0E10528g1_1 [Lachancea dasiensis]|uniref:LADA_0E10528g1_1 n=1 Tax=Lachancea dasiensis TaxID=1072105 RepID=A0A1G4JEQ8_9SACH|nr:LADA_0E10528g1_1 [Lachancea dasiensis]